MSYGSFDSATLEALMAQSHWMRALAIRLVGNPSDADEVVQDVWLAAVRKPPTSQNLRNWIRTVARRVTGRRSRGDARRKTRERALARSGAAPSAEALVERTQVQRAIAGAVLRLREPYRSTILFRYYDDLSAGEIADKHGVSIETVRSRVKRGLRQLRTSLDAEFGGSRSAWCIPLIIGFGWSRPQSLAAAGIGSILMKAGLVVLPLLVGGLLVSNVLDSTEPESRGDGREGSSSEDSHSRTVVARTTGPTPPTSSSTHGAARKRRLAQIPRESKGAANRLTGVVRDQRGNLIEGALVRAFEIPRIITRRTGIGPVKEVARSHTDSGGAFALGPFEYHVLVEIQARGHARVTKVMNPVGRTDWVLPDPACLAGRLVHADGWTSCRHVLVCAYGRQGRTGDIAINIRGFLRNGDPFVFTYRLACAHATTDGDGRFNFTDLEPGAYSIGAYPPQRSQVLLDDDVVSVAAGTTVERDFVIPPVDGSMVTGRVVDAMEGGPIAGAHVSVAQRARQAAETDEGGRFRLSDVVGPRASVKVEAPGFVTMVRRIPVPTGMSGVPAGDFVLQRPGRIRGRVVGPDGAPVPGAFVSTRAGDLSTLGRTRNKQSQLDGRFRLEAVRPGASRRVFAVADGFAMSASAPIAVRAGAEITPVLIRLRSAAQIDVQLVPTPGARLKDNPVCLRVRSGPGWMHDVVLMERTNEYGTVRFADLPAGTYQFAAWVGCSYRRFAECVTVSAGGRASVRLDLATGARISGRVTDGSGHPVPRARVEVVENGGRARGGLVFADRDGRFCLSGLQPGEYRLRVESFHPHRVRFVDRATTHREVRVVLVERQPIVGCVTVRDSSKPPSAFWIRVYRHDARHALGNAADRWFFAKTDGRFQVHLNGAWPDGVYAVEAETTEGLVSNLTFVRVGKDVEHGFLQLTVARGGRISVTTETAGGAPSPHARVRVVRAEDPAKIAELVGDDAGACTIGNLQPGEYLVEADQSNRRIGEKRVHVRAGQATNAIVVLRESGCLRVRIEEATGEAIAGATVELRSLLRERPWRRRSARTRQNGEAMFQALFPGSYRLRVLHNNGVRHESHVEIPVLGCQRKSICLSPLRELTFRVHGPEGSAIHGATIEATAMRRDGERPRRVRTNAQGIGRFRGLTPGEYQVEVRVPQFRTVRTRVTTGGAEATPIEVEVSPHSIEWKPPAAGR